MLYLIHFDRPYHHARHYVGCTHNVERRLAQHQSGTGAKLLRAVSRAGIGYTVVRTWEGYRQEEMQVKAQKNAPRLCPVCIQERIRTRLGIAHLTVQDMLPQAAPPPPAVCQEVLL